MMMSTSKHNKRRNSLLVYEWLVSTISRSLVENDKRKSTIALKIIRKHFKPGTMLYREFRLMNALIKTTVSSDHVAASILKEAKEAAVAVDMKALDREKSLLIRSINHTLNDPDFYDQHVNEYKTYATVQTLINEWRNPDKDLHKTAQFEDQLMKWLVTEKEVQADQTLSEDSTGSARLLMKVMTKKLNDKYASSLNDSQKSIVKAYALSAASDDKSVIGRKLTEIRDSLVDLVDQYADEVKHNDALRDKLTATKAGLVAENLSVVDDETVTRFMLYSCLRDELESRD